MKRIFQRSLSALILAVLFCSGVHSFEVDFTTVSTASTDGWLDARIGGNYVVWYKEEVSFSDYDIYVYDITTGLSQDISNNEDRDYYLNTDGTHIVYRHHPESASESIISYNLSSGQKTTLVTHSSSVTYPFVNGDYVVWEQYDTGDQYEIYLYQYSTGSTVKISDSPNYDQVGKIGDDYIVWRNYDGTYDIYLYDIINSNIIGNISNSPGYSNYTYDISGNYVVFHDNADGDADVYLYNCETGVKTNISNNDVNITNPKINGDYVVWYGNVDGDNEIYLYCISTSLLIQVTNNSISDTTPQIDGEFVVWTSMIDGNREIMGYRITTGETLRMTNNDYNDSLMDICGDYVLIYGNETLSLGTLSYEPFVPETIPEPFSLILLGLGTIGLVSKKLKK